MAIDENTSLFGVPSAPEEPKRDANGFPITRNYTQWGTNGAAAGQDVARYRGIGTPGQAAPRIDTGEAYTSRAQQPGAKSLYRRGRTGQAQARDFQMGSLALIQNAASGTGPSAAEAQMRRQMATGQNNQMAAAASVRGGAAAQAAALGAQTRRAALDRVAGEGDIRALRAKEMADARGQVFGAASGIRGQDQGLATDQARLVAEQRAQDAQNQQYNERMGWETMNAAQQAGAHAAGANVEADASRQRNQLAENESSHRNTMALGRVVSGAGSGAMSGAATARASDHPDLVESKKSDDDGWDDWD